MIRRRISIEDFRFKPTGFGRYAVTYTSPKTGKWWVTSITDMELIDATKNSPYPTLKALDTLKDRIKANCFAPRKPKSLAQQNADWFSDRYCDCMGVTFSDADSGL